MKRCPKCAEKIQSNAVLCRFCGAEQTKAKRVTNWRALGISAAVLAVLYVVGRFGDQTEIKPVVAEASRQPIPGEKCKGYNGESRNFAGLVRRAMRNPDSFEHVHTAYGPVENGTMLATMQYRGTNGFGAVDTKVATGQVRVSDCSARVLATE